MEIEGKVAVVTGGSRGLGVTVGRALGDAGARVALAARSREDLDAARERVAEHAAEAVAIRADVTDADDRIRLVDEVETALGPIDILVNNAGVEAVDAFDRLEPAAIEAVIGVNLTAALLLTREVLPGMLERRRGHVVNMASAAGKVGAPFQAVYSAGKFGLVGATAALRAEYHDRPVGFSAVCPGFVTDEGMYARFEEQGIRAPRLVGTTSPPKVARAVIRAIEGDRAEVIVNDVPLRPLLVLAQMIPSLQASMTRLTGITEMGRQASEVSRDS